MTTAEDVEREMTTEREEWTARDGVVSSHGGNGPIIAVAYGMDDATADERARRIAAVPDMEAALEECVCELIRLHERYMPSYDGPEGEPSKSVIEHGTAALRKAGRL